MSYMTRIRRDISGHEIFFSDRQIKQEISVHKTRIGKLRCQQDLKDQIWKRRKDRRARICPDAGDQVKGPFC